MEILENVKVDLRNETCQCELVVTDQDREQAAFELSPLLFVEVMDIKGIRNVSGRIGHNRGKDSRFADYLMLLDEKLKAQSFREDCDVRN